MATPSLNERLDTILPSATPAQSPTAADDVTLEPMPGEGPQQTLFDQPQEPGTPMMDGV